MNKPISLLEIIDNEILKLKPNYSRKTSGTNDLIYLSIDKSYAIAYANGRTKDAHINKKPINNGVLFHICLNDNSEHFGGDIWLSSYKDEILSDLNNLKSDNSSYINNSTKELLNSIGVDYDNLSNINLDYIINNLNDNNLSIISPIDWSHIQQNDMGYSEICVKNIKDNQIIKIEFYENGELFKTIKGNYKSNCNYIFYHGSPLSFWK